MGLFKIAIYFCLVFAPLLGFEQNRILFLMTQGNLQEAVDAYQNYKQTKGKHDFELLQQLSLLLLENGIKSSKPEEQLMALFGASIANNDPSIYLLEEGLRSSFPQIQLVAINCLGKSQNDHAYELINKAIGSPHPIIRLEAAYQIALKKHPKACAQVDALMQKLPAVLAPLFPQIFALIGDEDSTKILKKLMNNPNHLVRIATILSVMKHGRDDLLPQIRKLSTQHDVGQQEAAAYALGVFKDESSRPVLENLSRSSHPTVKIAALIALHNLGDQDRLQELQTLALQGNPFAIYALKDIPGTESTLAKLASSDNTSIRLNATLGLLALKDRRSLPGVVEILFRDIRDLAFTEVSSPGRALTYWKAVPSASQQSEDASVLLELSLGFREDVLQECLELSPQDFLKLSEFLFNKKQNDLIPMLVALLVNMDSKEAIDLLKAQQQKIGAPLIRNYSTLGLVKLKEEGPYRQTLKEWVVKQQEIDMLQFRAFVPFDMREPHSTYELTPQETARLLVESLELLSEEEDDEGIDLLLQVLKEGHSKNRYLIAGLLLHTVG